MNKEVKLTVIGTQIDDAGEKSYETTKEDGVYYCRNNTHYILVDDEMLAKNDRYKFNHRYLEVVKNGDINAKLYFEAGKTYTAEYRTPYGRMPLTFDTASLSLVESDGKIRISASYKILNEGRVLSDNTIDISVENR